MNDLTTYNSVKDNMQTGDLLQWSSNSLIGKLIRWKTKSDVNHSGVVLCIRDYETKEHRRWTLEALEHGLELNYLSRRLEKHNGRCFWHPLKKEFQYMSETIGSNMMAMAGIPYDYGSIFRQIFGRVSADARDLFCSEAVFLGCGLTGIAPNPGEMLKLGYWEETPVVIWDNWIDSQFERET